MLVGDDVPNAAVAALDQGADAPLPGLPRLRVAVAGEAESGPIRLGRLVRPYLTHEVVIGQLAPGLLLGTGGDALSRLRDGDGASVRVPETFEQHPRPRAGWWPRAGAAAACRISTRRESCCWPSTPATSSTPPPKPSIAPGIRRGAPSPSPPGRLAVPRDYCPRSPPGWNSAPQTPHSIGPGFRLRRDDRPQAVVPSGDKGESQVQPPIDRSKQAA